MLLEGAYYSRGQRHLSLMGGGSNGESRWGHVRVDGGKLGGKKQRVEVEGVEAVGGKECK